MTAPARHSHVAFLQSLGRALMLPIAVLPIAGLMLRLGQPDLLDIAVLSAAGDALFAHLGLLFAVGVATAFARDGNGAAALAGLTCYLVATNAASVFLQVPPEATAGAPDAMTGALAASWRAAAIARLQVPIGIVAGLIGGTFYNRFSTVKLPDYLAFFGGRRFVPIVAGLAGVGVALLLGPSYAAISSATDAMSRAVTESGSLGLFLFGVLNRLLLVTGLHHILNNVAYFVIGDYAGKTGDLARFFAGDPTAGGFMSGFFPVMMFGLPAACLAMYRTARPGQRKAVGGMLFSMALTSALTGVTEPIEFSFMFLAPLLYLVHALLTGAAEVVMNALGVRLGYSFSAGLFDYLLNYGRATRPLWLLPIGTAYALVYYMLFHWVIVRFDLKTPGRGPEEEGGAAAPVAESARAAAWLAGLGGAANIRAIEACATRLRLSVVDPAAVDDAALARLGAHGVLRPGAGLVQVVVGGVADALSIEIRDHWTAPPAPAAPVEEAAARPKTPLPDAMIAALGGADNLVSMVRHPGRWRVAVLDEGRVARDRLSGFGLRAVIEPSPNIFHLLEGSAGT